MRMQYHWLGKLCGSFLGYLITQHWAGMLIGMFLGHAYDLYRTQVRILESAQWYKQGWGFGDKKSGAGQSGFTQTLFFVLGKLAKCDGYVTTAEIAWAEQLMRRLYLNPQQRQEAINWFNQGKQPDIDVSPLLSDFSRFAVPFGLNTLFLELMVECALSDGTLNPQERALLVACSENLKLPPGRLDELVRRVSRPGYWANRGGESGDQQTDARERMGGQRESVGGHRSERFHEQSYAKSGRPSGAETTRMAYEVLGVSEGASRSEVKRAYRKLMNLHHPDKLMSQGLPEPMLNLAKEKTQAIQKAFEVIAKARGFK